MPDIKVRAVQNLQLGASLATNRTQRKWVGAANNSKRCVFDVSQGGPADYATMVLIINRRHHVRAAAAANGATTVPPVRNAEHLKRHDVRIRFRPPDPDRAKPRPIRQPPQRDRPKFSLLRVIRLPTGSLRVWRAPEATSPACQSSRPISVPSDSKSFANSSPALTD